jgi:hypothetical protein
MKVLLIVAVLALSACTELNTYKYTVECTNDKTFSVTSDRNYIRLNDGSVEITHRYYLNNVISSYTIPENVSCSKQSTLLQ